MNSVVVVLAPLFLPSLHLYLLSYTYLGRPNLHAAAFWEAGTCLA